MGRRKFTAEFKRKVVVQAMRGDETVRTIAARGTVRVTGSDKYNLQSRALRLSWRHSAMAAARCCLYVAARIMLRRVPEVALDMSSLQTSAT